MLSRALKHAKMRMISKKAIYKIKTTFLFGLLSSCGTLFLYHLLGLDKTGIYLSLVFPFVITLAWGEKYGLLSVLTGLAPLYPFLIWPSAGLGNMASAIQILLLVLIHGYGSEKRQQGSKHLLYNVYVLQITYSLLSVCISIYVFPWLLHFNVYLNDPKLLLGLDMTSLVRLAVKIVVLFLFIGALSDVLLLLPTIRKTLRLGGIEAAKSNSIILFCYFIFTCISIALVMTVNSVMIYHHAPFEWLQRISPEFRLDAVLVSLIGLFFGGFTARYNERRISAEEKIKHSEKKYRNIFENISDLYMETNLDGTILHISPSVASILGYQANDLLGKNVILLYSEPEERTILIDRIKVQTEFKNATACFKTKDGKTKVLWRHIKVLDLSGEGRRILSISRDVTEYLEAKKKEEESRAQYEMLYNTMPVGFVTFDAQYDDTGNLINLLANDCNPAFSNQFSTSNDHLDGKTWSYLFGTSSWQPDIVQTVLNTGDPTTLKFSDDERDSFWEGIIFKVKENQIAALVSNITELVKAEKEIKDLRTHLEAIMESADYLIGSVDRNYNIFLCNSSARTYVKNYFDIDLKAGLHTNQHFPDDFPNKETWIQKLEQVAKTGEASSFELLTEDKTKYFEFSLHPICNDDDVQEIALFGKDITKRKLAEQEVLKLNAELEQRVSERTAELYHTVNELEAFTYTVSHDLKSPLRAIEGYNRILLEDYHDKMDEEMIKIMKSISGISGSTIKAIDSLLQYSMTSQKGLNKETVEMDQMFTEIFENFKAVCPERKIELRLEGKIPSVQADKSLIMNVVCNIITNAIKFTRKREKALIRVGCQSFAQENIYFVKDNGVGFDMEYSGKLFGIFQRLHSPKEYEGNGIGLATVRKIIQKHGGKTWMEGEVDNGATVYFSLPKN